MLTFLIIFVVILYLKWIVFILSLPVIRIVQQSKFNKLRSIDKTVNYPMEKPPSKSTKKSGLRGLFSFTKRYLMGYMRYADFQTGMIPSHHVRNFLYRHIWLVDMGKDAIIYFGAEIRDAYKLSIGQGSIIGDRSLLDARNGIEIGENVNFSSNVSIYTEQHDHRDPLFRCISSSDFKVKIGNRAWIGPNVIILHSVTIGEGAVVAAGAVVTKNVEPYTLVAGIPAKKIGNRNRNLRYYFKGKPVPFY